MKQIIIAASALALGALVSGAPAQAKGCLKGAAVGGVAGHMAGHGKAGAAAGCAVGHSKANKGGQGGGVTLYRPGDLLVTLDLLSPPDMVVHITRHIPRVS
jgi:hypothetical protein